ncbi:Serine/threonine-protein phosphatase [Giardia muris]|uniref:Serine/threonine-protein phosphatase n=1 Tax=Giardia muris TaxID=5742 RepID=A0A4Z1SW53_GIAMU|nr:Serine/threonine-protein phosphatase [Giardia muris]|eukprot:TNJ29976.1 Serine/threonine-protein phosphatase [Giardia muris]
MIDPQKLLELTWQRKPLAEDDIRELVWRVQAILAQEPNVLNLSGPINICGDLHGQFYDVVKLFDVGGRIDNSAPNQANMTVIPFNANSKGSVANGASAKSLRTSPTPKKYLFLGDYVDRGYFSLETVTLLYLLKLCYPNQIYLIRGNHECRSITQVYGFYEQCQRYYMHSAVWKLFVDSFDYLPIAAVVDNRIFGVHGGLSPKCPSLDSIRTIQRSLEIPSEGSFTDLCWSDPEPKVSMFSPSTRGAGFLFGAQAVEKFNGDNGIEIVTRAHQLAAQGYQWYFNNKCCTCWSCPNYFYKCKNLAAVMEIDTNGGGGICFLQFDAVPDNEREKPDLPKK